MQEANITYENVVNTIKAQHQDDHPCSMIVEQGLLPERMFKHFYAMFYEGGVTIYDDHEKDGLVEFGELKWEDFSDVVLKHFKHKTKVSFYAEDRFRVLTVADHSGRRIEEFLKENTSVNVIVVGLRWYNKIPGFRSETRWKMILSAIIYLWIVGMVYNFIL